MMRPARSGSRRWGCSSPSSFSLLPHSRTLCDCSVALWSRSGSPDQSRYSLCSASWGRSPQLISLLVRGFLGMWEPLYFFRSHQPPRGVRPISLPLLLLPLFLHSVLPGHLGIFFVLSSVQGLWLVFSWCPVRTVPSVDVFLMHLWREMNSMSTYSSAILPPFTLNLFLISFLLPGETDIRKYR